MDNIWTQKSVDKDGPREGWKKSEQIAPNQDKSERDERGKSEQEQVIVSKGWSEQNKTKSEQVGLNQS